MVGIVEVPGVAVGSVAAGMVVEVVGIAKSYSNDDGKLIETDMDISSSSTSNTSENIGGLLVSLRRCLSAEGSDQSSTRSETLGDMTLNSRIR
jgi:hypothetical protein